ncbi:MAG: hypothetical protein GKR98_03365 [Boseongicola sp.]|nr:MAG: hypothetical protein GKR98_03365 [Boseongicola sp.]
MGTPISKCNAPNGSRYLRAALKKSNAYKIDCIAPDCFSPIIESWRQFWSINNFFAHRPSNDFSIEDFGLHWRNI